MKRVVFVDAVCPHPYDFEYLKDNPSGASESYLNMLARALHLKGVETYIFQHNRKKPDLQHGIKYVGFDDLETINKNDVDAVVIQRHPAVLDFVKDNFKNAKVVIWQHDFFESTNFQSMSISQIKDWDIPIVCVSDWHSKNFKYNFKLRGSNLHPVVIPHFVVENPITLKNDLIQPKLRDKYKLAFFSSEHKGLHTSLKAFSELFLTNTDYQFYIASPSYKQIDIDVNLPNVHQLGKMSRQEILEFTSECFALVHLNSVYPETFGCINAEANLVGTPVISYDYGANKEVIDRFNDYAIKPLPYSADTFGYDMFIKKMLELTTINSPTVQLKKQFTVENILPKWQNLLELY